MLNEIVFLSLQKPCQKERKETPKKNEQKGQNNREQIEDSIITPS